MATIEGAGSLTKRPDSVSRNYLIGYSVGPIARANPAEGVRAILWRLRWENGDFLLNKEVAGEWDADRLLFSAPELPVEELDFCFDQNAQIFVTFQSGDGVYIYFFDSLLGQYTYRQFAVGRTPRILLDELDRDSQSSDVLLFYIDSNDRCRVLQQRERFAVEYAGPFEAPNRYLERVYIAADHRLHLWYSERDVERGTYTIGHYETVLYGIRNTERLRFTSEPQLVEVLSSQILVSYFGRPNASPYINDERVRVFSRPQLIEVMDLLRIEEITDESLRVTSVPQGITVVLALIVKTANDESLRVTSVPQSVQVNTILFERILQDESVRFTSVPQLVEITA